MSVLKEVVYEIDYWSPPLKKHRYSMNSVSKRIRKEKGGATGILMQELEKRDKAARESGLLLQQDNIGAPSAPLSDAGSAGLLTGEYVAPVYTEAPDAPSAPPKRFRTLNQKIEKVLYDDTLVQKGKLEDEAYETLNADGYYDEPLPVDAGENYAFEDEADTRKTVILLGVVAFLVVILVAYIKFIF